MAIDRRVARRYEVTDEDARLWSPGRGELIRRRSWDVFARTLPPAGRLLDVGGGPGVHAAHLAAAGHRVTLIEPVARHLARAAERATERTAGPPSFGVVAGVAEALPVADRSCDAVLLMGPLYHLVTRDERLVALAEAHRVLRPGGHLLAEVITRHAWLLDATLKGLLGDEGTWATIEHSVRTGESRSADAAADGDFWAWFHTPDDLAGELADAGFAVERLVGVEGYGWLLGDLEERMATDPDGLLRALRLVESEPSLLGCSAHVIGVATRPGGP
jgi:SAM-dependent methyltransferase